MTLAGLASYLLFSTNKITLAAVERYAALKPGKALSDIENALRKTRREETDPQKRVNLLERHLGSIVTMTPGARENKP